MSHFHFTLVFQSTKINNFKFFASVILHFEKFWLIKSRKMWHISADTRFRDQLSKIKVKALSQEECDFGASRLTFLNFCFPVYRVRTIVAVSLWAPRRTRLLSWNTNKIVYVNTLSNQIWCMLVVTITTIIIIIISDFQWRLPELFPLELCAVSVTVETVTLSSQY